MKVSNNSVQVPIKTDNEQIIHLRASEQPSIKLKATSSNGETASLSVRCNEVSLGLKSDISLAILEGLPYTGQYVVDPEFKLISLPTKNRLLTENVSVKPIEVQRVTNQSGGITVYIGGNIHA